MLNKKIIAASIAAVFAQSALAAVDLDDQTGPVTYANDIVGFTLNQAGNLEVTNTMAGLLDVEVELGFTIGAGTSKYVLIQLDGASFDAVPTLTVGTGAPQVMGTISQGGSIGSSFVLFEVAAQSGLGNDLPQTAPVVLDGAAFEIDPDVVSTVTYRLFETAQQAVSALAGDDVTPLHARSGDFTETGSGSSGQISNGFTNTATVQSNFTNFNGASLSATTALIGEIDTDLVVSDPTYTAAGALTVATDFLADTQDILFSGNMSFGTWTLQESALCDGAGSSIPVTNTTATGGEVLNVADTTLDANVWSLCVTVDGSEKIEKGPYNVELEEDGYEDYIGQIVYDTTTIEVPYITTFYQQRLILVNTSAEEAAYSISFLSEPGTVAEGVPGVADGTIPANGMVVLATQGNNPFLTITGTRTRTSATIEVESVDGNIQAATQTVSSDGTATDTVVLNANSVISYSTLQNLFENNNVN